MTAVTKTGALAFAALLLSPAALGQEGEGFAEVRAALYPGASGEVWQLVERVRPTLSAELLDRVSLVVTVEGGLRQGRDPEEELARALLDSDLRPLLEAGGYRAPAYENELLRLNDRHGYLDVDRLYVDLYTDELDLRVGRQAVNWGSARFFNPTDPFPEVLLAEPWRPRRGVNALRLTVPFGSLNDAMLVAALDDALVDPRLAGRVRVNVLGTDFAVVGAWRGGDRDVLVGVDVRGTLVLGWWIEAAYLLGEDPHEEIAVGVDYSFPVLERLLLFAQYYRNGAGAAKVTGLPLPGEGSALLTGATVERDPFAPFTRGRDYLLVGSTLGVFPELSASAMVLQNLNDGSGFVVPTVAWFALDWLELAGSAQLPYALFGSGEFRPSDDDLRLEVAHPGSGQPLTADLSGLVPAATLTLWARLTY